MTPRSNQAFPYLVVGAGPSGLAALHRLHELGLPVEGVEQADDVGGNWYFGSAHSSVAASTHLISSKRLTEFPDYRMPREYPHYPSHHQAWDYLRSYAHHFNLYPLIRFGRRVERITRTGEDWTVQLAGEADSRTYSGVIIANGHHWHPRRPAWAADFAGELIHAHDYKTPDVLRGKRVLVVGAGNSGCDIAVESALHATSTVLSMRRGYYFLPKYLCGAPLDRGGDLLHRWRLPRWLRDRISEWLLYVAAGPPERYGLPRPDHRLFETHPIVNSLLPYFVGHNRIQIAPDVTRVQENEVQFTDGRSEEFDLIVLATGYHVSFPFLASSVLDGDQAIDKLYLNAFVNDQPNLFVSGLFQPNGAIWPLSDLQSQLIARLIIARDRRLKVAEEFDHQRRRAHSSTQDRHYLDTPRHRLEVDYHHYKEILRRWIAKFDREI
jgi:cation diffusion facilitator CzcD-associated flavoprotein CzcO